MQFYTNVTQWGNNILLREYKNGERVNRKIKYSPTMYVPVQKKTEYKTLDGKYATPYKFDTIKEAKKFIEQYKQQPHLVFGLDRFAYTFLYDTYPNQVPWDNDKILTVTIDIETQCENGFPDPQLAVEEMLSITIKNQTTKKIVVWGIGDYHTDRDDVTYINCSNENELLAKFMNFWTKHYPDVVTGWNTEFFDIPYIINRVTKVLGEDRAKEISPWGLISSRTVYNHGRNQQVYDISGVANLDYLQLYHKFTYTRQESYALNYIASVELGAKKNENPYDTFKDWYTKDYQSFIDYNIVDVELVDQLEDKMKLLELCLTMAYEAKVNYEDVFGQVKYWDVMIHNYLRKKNVVIPQKSHSTKVEKFEGAYVKDPQVGMHKWVMSFDLNSLYPHIIMQYNISPEKMVKEYKEDVSIDRLLNKQVDISYLKQQNNTVCPNGTKFKRDRQGFLPELMEKFYDERKAWKKKMIDYQIERESCKDAKRRRELDTLIKRANNNQMVRKIALNSAYGALANQYFAFFSIDLAEAITTSGQLIIQWSERTINEFMNKTLGTEDEGFVIAMDTDSVYITMDKLVQKVLPEETDKGKIIDFLNKSEGMFEKVLAEGFDDLAQYTNAFQQKMEMGREVIADRGIWTAKKRYILNVHDNEGVRLAEPKLKMMGIETAKSSTPQWVRTKLTEAFKVVMSGTEQDLWEFVENSRKEFRNLPPEEVAFPRGCKGLVQYTCPTNIYSKGTPIHVRGSLLYNHHLKKRNIDRRYEMIKNGEKIHFSYLTTPNPINENVISFMNVLPREFDLHRFIDYDMQFDKAFVDPLKVVISLIGWNVEPVASLDSFFG